MGLYQKNKAVIEARQYHADNKDSIINWCGGQLSGGSRIILVGEASHQTANHGDWIICDDGRFYPISNEIFKLEYVTSTVSAIKFLEPICPQITNKVSGLCKSCRWFVLDLSLGKDNDENCGECRKRSPATTGHAIVPVNGWCGDHSLPKLY